jgi:orotate phosphoribosyltransferase
MPTIWLDLLERSGAVCRGGHFVYQSGRHGPDYVNKDAIYLRPATVSRLCGELADRFEADRPGVVAGPAIGGVILAQWTTFHLDDFRGEYPVRAVYAEPAPGGGFEFRRGYGSVVAGAAVLLVEDVLTTGESARAVVRAVVAAGGRPIGLACLCNRGGVTAADLGVPDLFGLVELPLESYPADDCPLCRSGVPVNAEVGRGRQFLAGRGGRNP